MLKRRDEVPNGGASMAVTSADWPRFSLLMGADVAFAQPKTTEVQQTLLRHLSDRFTCECWVQTRFSKQPAVETSETHGCWLLHAPSWACGVTTDLQVVVHCDGVWLSSPKATLKPRKWHHLAVAYEVTQAQCWLSIDGEQLELLGTHVDIATLRLPVSPSSGVRIGWSPLSASPSQLLLHECRLWKRLLSGDVLQSWMGKTPSTDHPHGRDLVAHWAFSSGSELREETDLSGWDHHLVVIRNRTDVNHWLRITPVHFRREVHNTNARLTLWQGAQTNSRESPFVLQIDVAHDQPEADRLPQCFEGVLVVLVLNFLTFPSLNLTSPGRGTGVVDNLQQFIRRLPPSSAVSIFSTDNEPATRLRSPVLSVTAMTLDNKIQACKAIERLKLKCVASTQEMPTIVGECIHHVVAAQPDNSPEHSIIAAVIIDEAEGIIQRRSTEEMTEDVHACCHTIEVHHVKLTSRAPSGRHQIQSRTYLSYFSCEQDLQWVLAGIIDRVGRYLISDVTLTVESDPSLKTWMSEDLEAVRGVFDSQDLASSHTKSFGCLVDGDSIVLHGATECSSLNSGSAVTTARLSYRCPDGGRRIAGVTLRYHEDLTNHVHIERAARNARLRVNSDESLLLEQRRDLMKRKGQFVTALVSAEVADADNSFKKINIMKEELWSKRNWIAQRGLRLTQEDERKQLATEAKSAEERFTIRTSTLNEQVASKIRETGTRGASRNSRESINHRVQLRHEETDARFDGSRDEGDDELDGFESQLHKTVVKLDVQTKALSDHVAKLEDLFVSVRLAESRGPIIMNDTQRSWIVRLNDMMKVEGDVLKLTRQKDKIEGTIALNEEKLATRQEIEGEVNFVDSAIARYDLELSKRRKRVMLCLKDITDSVVEEFSASQHLRQEQLELSWCSALKSLDIKPAMYPSCIYVCFPIDLSILDLPPSSSSRSFVNVWCAVCHGLLHCCDRESQMPLCRRLSFSESFLWWGVQQQSTCKREEAEADAHFAIRQRVQAISWATIVVTYNSLFSSARAMADLRSTLIAARDHNKPVFHIKLEELFESLEGFRSAWCRRDTPLPTGQSELPVEREFLLWKQNLSSFHSLLSSLASNIETLGPVGLPSRCCEHFVGSDILPLMPCIKCTWPYVSSTSVSHVNQSEDYVLLVGRLGSWIDNLTSALLQSAPRSYHTDPKAVSQLSRDWQILLQGDVASAESKCAEARNQRVKEIHRQIGKMMKVYEDEAQDFVGMEFKLDSRRNDVLNRMRNHLVDLEAETRLLETRLNQLEKEDDESEDNRVRCELEAMLSEELHQHLKHAESKTLLLESLDERDERPTQPELEEAKHSLDQALRRSSQAILQLGRTYVENCFRLMLHELKKGELMDQIELATERAHDYSRQIYRLEKAFEDGERIRSAMLEQRESFVLDDASDFFYASVLEVRSPSSTSESFDLHEIRKLSNDVEMHIAMHASVLALAMQQQLAYSTALEYRTKLLTAIRSFCHHYCPSTSRGDNSAEDIRWLKDFCQLSTDKPSKSWNSLNTMEELVDKEIRHDRALNRLLGQWKLRFFDTLLDFHTRHWWSVCQRLLQHQTNVLTQVNNGKATAFQKLKIAESAFRSAVEDREKFHHRLALLQRRLVEIKERQSFLLGLLQVSRKFYESATIVMNEQLQNVKTDVIYKNWCGVADYHVGLIGELFDLRSQCAMQLDKIQDEIAACQKSLAASEETVRQQRMSWVKESIADNIVCTRAENWQRAVHESLDQIVSLEKQRVYQHFRVLDPRGMWITDKTLSSWFETNAVNQRMAMARRKGGRVRRTDVDDSLIQLAIARLDLIKQEKLKDSLERKVVVLDRMLRQQIEMRQIVAHEVATYQALGERLTARVRFIREKHEDSSHSQYLDYTTGNQQASSIDRAKAVDCVRASREQLRKMISAAQQDYLAADATTCQLSWRVQQYLTSGYRAQRLIDEMNAQLHSVQQYLDVLKRKDHELFDQAMSDASTGEAGSDNECEANDETDLMGMGINTGLIVCEYHARDQWFRTCLSETTTLGEKVKSLRAVLVSLESISQGGDKQAPLDIDATETIEQDDQIKLVARELQCAELSLLLNRFESRTAERTSETLKELLVANSSEPESLKSINTAGNSDLSDVVPYEVFKKRMFSSSLCVTVHNKMMTVLRELATTFDPRDVAGNLSEVIYGASLDRNHLKRIFLLQSRAHVEEQWGVVFVVLFFSRLFRRVALQKAAKRRYAEAAIATQYKLRDIQSQQDLIGRILRCEVPEYSDDSLHRHSDGAQALLHHVQLHVQEGGSAGELSRIALGVAMKRPLHRILMLTVPGLQATATALIADALAESRALVERRPPIPTQLEVIALDRYTIKIRWKPITRDHDLIYIAEISEHQPVAALHEAHQSASKRFWHQFQPSEPTSHTFYSLHPGHSYWVRVRAGFSRTKLGDPCLPLLVCTLV